MPGDTYVATQLKTNKQKKKNEMNNSTIANSWAFQIVSWQMFTT